MRWRASMNTRLERTPCSSTGPAPTESITLPARSSVRPRLVRLSRYSPHGCRMTRSGQRSPAANAPMHGLSSTWARCGGLPAGGSTAATIAAAQQRTAAVLTARTPGVVACAPVRVLSIDGGGIRGLIPALVLAEVERRSGRRTFELFDLIAGTSTGGILACALCAPDPLPAAELVAIYEEEGPSIFDRSLGQRIRSADGLLDEKYDGGALDRALERFLGMKRLSETKPDLIVPAYDTALPGPYFFKSEKARAAPASDDFPLSVVARATSAAPTYFEPVEAGEGAPVGGGGVAAEPG